MLLKIALRDLVTTQRSGVREINVVHAMKVAALCELLTMVLALSFKKSQSMVPKGCQLANFQL